MLSTTWGIGNRSAFKEITLVDVDRELGNYLVLSPGPGTPSSAGLYKTIIENYWQQISTLGVCLGMQAINEIFGESRSLPPDPDAWKN